MVEPNWAFPQQHYSAQLSFFLRFMLFFSTSGGTRESWSLCGRCSTITSIGWALPLQQGCGSVLVDRGWVIFFSRFAQGGRTLVNPWLRSRSKQQFRVFGILEDPVVLHQSAHQSELKSAQIVQLLSEGFYSAWQIHSTDSLSLRSAAGIYLH